jgi:hypothetical protein
MTEAQKQAEDRLKQKALNLATRLLNLNTNRTALGPANDPLILKVKKQIRKSLKAVERQNRKAVVYNSKPENVNKQRKLKTVTPNSIAIAIMQDPTTKDLLPRPTKARTAPSKKIAVKKVTHKPAKANHQKQKNISKTPALTALTPPSVIIPGQKRAELAAIRQAAAAKRNQVSAAFIRHAAEQLLFPKKKSEQPIKPENPIPPVAVKLTP